MFFHSLDKGADISIDLAQHVLVIGAVIVTEFEIWQAEVY
jgi:hypothetical protein